MVALQPYRPKSRGRPEPLEPETVDARRAVGLTAVPPIGRGAEAQGPGVLIIVQNLSVPFDRRVWLECQTLAEAGFQVSVICPREPEEETFEVVDGVAIYRYRPATAQSGKFGYLIEYSHAFLATAWLTMKARRRQPFDVLQACNPPDIFWPIALAYRLRGVRFVFDHHDLCPELFESRFGGHSRALLRALRVLEGRTFRSAHHVISTNESYRQVALTRGGRRGDQVTVVRSGPDLKRLRRRDPVPALRRGRQHLVAYLGVMGPQDGVDLAVKAAHHIVHGRGRRDVTFAFMGSGDCFDDLVELTARLDLTDHVSFTGRVPDDMVADVLSTADVGLCPDPKNPLNDVSTMNKTLEYMAFGLPVVAFDLHETRVSAEDAAVYATPNEVEDFASKVLDLLDDEDRRHEMAKRGRMRLERSLAWPEQGARYLAVYRALTADRGARPTRRVGARQA